MADGTTDERLELRLSAEQKRNYALAAQAEGFMWADGANVSEWVRVTLDRRVALMRDLAERTTDPPA